MTQPIRATPAEIPQLTVWIRASGPSVQEKIHSFVLQVLASLPQNIPYQLLVCTEIDDPIEGELDPITKVNRAVRVIFSRTGSFSAALTALAENTDPHSAVLTMSVGVTIRQDQIETGLGRLTGRVRVYGWMVEGYGNDGSCPGRGWYNTAALIHQTVVGQMREGVPGWVDNGVLGNIDGYIIGGNEEIPIMVEALSRDPDAQFILDIGDPVTSGMQIGTGVTFRAKLERKTIVGEVYMRKLHRDLGVPTAYALWKDSLWAALQIVDQK